MSIAKTHVITCSRDGRNELVAAECETLTGGRPNQWGVAVGEICRVQQGAFLRSGVELVAQSRTLQGLTEQVAQLSPSADDFRIEWLAAGYGGGDRWEPIAVIADQIQGKPNLKNPRNRLLLLAEKGGMSLGRIQVEADKSYRRHDEKPQRTSSSLPAQLARALVNLVAPDANTIVDPCCGTGSILLEASLVGLKAQGRDWNPRMVEMSRENASHFGYEERVDLADARDWKEPADAVVTDLPYGRGLEASEEVIRGILSRMRAIAPVAVFVAGDDLADLLRDAGYRQIDTYRVPKSKAFTRYVHRARRDGLQDRGPHACVRTHGPQTGVSLRSRTKMCSVTSSHS